jgi:AraC-like DNA-binding protein
MSISRHSADRSIRVRSFGVTFQSGQKMLHPVVPAFLGAWHQLVYATRGVMTVRTEQGLWVVPPHRGAWIPAGSEYQVELSGVVAVRNLYIKARRQEKKRFPRAPAGCSVVNVTPLLRELIVRINLLGALDDRVPEHRRLLAVLFDELKTLVTVPLQLPSPQEPRAAKFAGLANTLSGAGQSLEEMLRQCGASRRTMERIFSAEAGMSLGQWLRRQKLLHALRLLAGGECVNSVALELGYNSPSAFIAMFHRELGQTPRRYFES